MRSDQIATNLMDLDDFDIYGKIFIQWFWKKQKIASKMEVQLQILKRLRQKFEDFRCYLLAFLDYKTEFLVSLLVSLFGNVWKRPSMMTNFWVTAWYEGSPTKKYFFAKA